MHFHFSFYSSILLIFFCQGLALSFLLFKKGILQASKPSVWLGFFLFLCTIYLLPWMLGFAGWYSLQPYRDIMFYIPFQQLFLIGPAIYFYTQSLLNPSFKFQKKHYWHLLPAIGYLLYRLVVFVTDKIILKDYYFYANGRDKGLDTWYQVAGMVSMIVYFLLSLQYYTVYKKLIFETLSFADAVLFSWIKKYLIAFMLMQILGLLFFYLFPNWGSFQEKWWYYLFFSALLYYIGITGYANNVKSLVPFTMSDSQQMPAYVLENSKPQPIVDETTETVYEKETLLTIPDVQLEAWKEKINTIITAEKLYQNPTLTLANVALKLNTNQTLISKMINQGFKMNFNDFINTYRIEAIKQLLQQGEHKQHTLMGIAYDCGFNSKTTFNRCFKNNTGLSPKEYIKTMTNNTALRP